VDAKTEIVEALASAAKTHRRVILVFGGNWCYDCHALDAAFRSAEIAPIVNKNFVVVHVNIGEYDKNLDLADKYDVPLKKGVPASAVLGSDGTLLALVRGPGMPVRLGAETIEVIDNGDDPAAAVAASFASK